MIEQLMAALIFADPVTLTTIAVLSTVASAGAAGVVAKKQSDAADESADQARIEKRRVGFQKLQKDRKILRETSRERARGLQNAVSSGVDPQSSAVVGGAQSATKAGSVALGANTAQFGFFNQIQDSKIREAGFLGDSATFSGASDIFGSFATLAGNQRVQNARNS